MKRFFSVLFLFFATALFSAGDSLDSLKGLSFVNAKIPVYQRDSLQMMLFADKGKRDGDILRGEGIVLDMIARTADVDRIADGWKTRPYALGAPLTQVLDFWKTRHIYSQSVMTSPRGDVDQKNRRAFGNEKVFFRSPTLDLNGVGFVADFKRHTIQVNSDVDIVMRNDSCDPLRILSGAPMPEEYHYMTATCDSLLIDNDRSQVLLIGSAHVREKDSVIDSDKMTIFLKSGSSKNENEDETLLTSTSGIDYVLADGSVDMRDGEEQRALSDHLRYDIAKNIVTLTVDPVHNGGKSRRVKLLSIDPVTKQTTSTLTADRAVFFRGRNYAIFTGNVNVCDNAGNLDCDQLELFLTDAEKKDSDRVIGGGSASAKLERAVARGNVHMTDPKSTLDCEIMTLCFSARKDAEKTENAPQQKTGLLHAGQSSLSRIVCEGNVRGYNAGEAEAGAQEAFGPLGNGGRGGRRFTADILVSDQETDLTELHGNVCMRDNETKLECAEMFIYGKPRRQIAENEQIEDPDADPFSLVDSESYAPSRVLLDSDSELDRIVCEQNVFVTNGKKGGKLSRAEGDHGLYRVEDRRFTITSDPGKYCRIRSDGRLQRCEVIHYELEYERFIGESSPGRAVYSEIDKEPIPEL